MPYPICDAFLTRKSRHVWRWSVVIRGSDGGFSLLKRNGDDPVLLSPPLKGKDPFATFYAARKELYRLRDEAKAAK